MVPSLAIESTGSPAWLRSAMQALAHALPDAEHRALEAALLDQARAGRAHFRERGGSGWAP